MQWFQKEGLLESGTLLVVFDVVSDSLDQLHDYSMMTIATLLLHHLIQSVKSFSKFEYDTNMISIYNIKEDTVILF